MRWTGRTNRTCAGSPANPSTPDFYRAVPTGPDGVVRLESELFVESTVPEHADEAAFEWRGRRYTVEAPTWATRAFVEVPNLAAGRLCVVVRRRRPWWHRLRARQRRPAELSHRALPLPATRR